MSGEKTEFHDLNTPPKGTTDWHQPLNENFDRIDTLLRKTGAQEYRAIVYKDGGEVIALGQDGSIIARDDETLAGTVIQAAYDYVGNNFDQGITRIASGTYILDVGLDLHHRGSSPSAGYGIAGPHASQLQAESVRIMGGEISGADVITITANYNTIQNITVTGEDSGRNKQNKNLIRGQDAQTIYLEKVRLTETIGYGALFEDSADSTWLGGLITNCGSAKAGTVGMQIGQGSRQAGLRAAWLKFVNVFGDQSVSGDDQATCLSVQGGSNAEMYYLKTKTNDEAAGQHVINIGSGSGLKGVDIRATTTQKSNADALYAEGRVEILWGNFDGCRYGVHLNGANDSRLIGVNIQDTKKADILCNAIRCSFDSMETQGADLEGVLINGNLNRIVSGRYGMIGGGDQPTNGIEIDGDENRVIGAFVEGSTASLTVAGTGNVIRDCHFEDGLGSVADGTVFNGEAIESANAETPQKSYPAGTIVRFTDSGDGSGDGTYLIGRDGSAIKVSSAN